MTILSSYPLADAENARIAGAARGWGDLFIPSPEEQEARIAHIDRYITEADIFFGGRLTAEQFERGERLRWIHVPWAGVNSLLAVESIRRSEVTVTNSSGAMSDSVADQVLGYIIALARSLPDQIRAQERRAWEKFPTESPKRQALRGKTVGIVGYGAIGRGIALRARAFGMRVVASKRDVSREIAEVDRLYPTDRLPELLAESDYVVMTVPLTSETTGMMGSGQFRMMKPDAAIINISRGDVIREAEMIEALRDGTIGAAALDVFEKEPLPPDSPLWGMEKVIVTPHTAGGFQGFARAVVEIFLDNLDRFHRGLPLRNPISRERGY